MGNQRDRQFTLPKNIRQIGNFGDTYKIYVEDFVYTYVHRTLHMEKQDLEKPRKELTDDLTDQEKDILVGIFVENKDQLEQTLREGMNHEHKVLVLTEPLCDLETRKRIFRDIIAEYGTVDGEPAQILMWMGLFTTIVI